VAVSGDGRRAVSASGDRTLKVWDLDAMREVAAFRADAAVTCCTLAADASTIVAGDTAGRVLFLRLEAFVQTP